MPRKSVLRQCVLIGSMELNNLQSALMGTFFPAYEVDELEDLSFGTILLDVSSLSFAFHGCFASGDSVVGLSLEDVTAGRVVKVTGRDVFSDEKFLAVV